MGLLPPEYYKNLPQPTPVKQPVSAQGEVPTPKPEAEGFDPFYEYVKYAPKPLTAPSVTPTKPIRIGEEISEEEQIKRFGGAVGTTQYYDYKVKHPYISFLPSSALSAVGIPLPDLETWDKMSRSDQAVHLGAELTTAPFRLLMNLPRAMASLPVTLTATLLDAPKGVKHIWEDFRNGKEELPPDDLAPVRDLKWLGQTPTWFDTYDEARKAGVGEWGSLAHASIKAANDVIITGVVADAFTKAFQPRQALKPGEKITDITPISQKIIQEEGKFKSVSKAEGSTSEYYPFRDKAFVKEKFGGNVGNTLLKVAPAGADSVEVSVVQLRGGALQRGADWVKNKLGNPEKLIQGDYGPEVKLTSQIIKVPEKISAPAGEFPELAKISETRLGPTDKVGELTLRIDTLRQALDETPAKRLAKYANKSGELPEVTGMADASEYGRFGDAIASEMGFADDSAASLAYEQYRNDVIRLNQLRESRRAAKGETFVDYTPEQMNQINEIITETAEKIKNKTYGGQIVPIVSAPLKGFENKPITGYQLKNLTLIGEVNGIEPVIQESIIKTLTGKNVVGELTQKEYATIASTLANLNNVSKYVPEVGGIAFRLSSYASPERYWARAAQRQTGLPVYDTGVVAFDEAIRLAKISEQKLLRELWENPIIDKYSGAKYAQERRLVTAYRQGFTQAILENETLSQAVKNDLIQVAKTFDEFYAKVGPDVNVPIEIFLERYSPHIADIGGKFQMYKGTTEFPGSKEFYAKYKRHGSLATLIDDEWQLAKIYVRAGYKAKYFDPVLREINNFKDKLPPIIYDRLKSSIQEKMGYAGGLEQLMDGWVVSLKKMGIEVPSDFSRVITNHAMNTMYASAMSQPATWLRNALQYPTLGYAYWGSKFMTPAMKTAWSKGGIDEFLKSGFSVDLGVPFGEELAQDISMTGRASNAYRDITQGILGPNAWAEVRNRASMYFQTKYIFEDTISRLNAGKITWDQAEKELFSGLDPLDKQLVRQKLAAGDMEGGLNLVIKNAIDDTQFPYRRGASMKLSYGMSGHLSTAFTQWPVEYFHTMGKWVATKQWDKLIRMYASQQLVIRTMKDAFGWDFSQSFGFQPFTNISFSPMIKAGESGLLALYNLTVQNSSELENNKEELLREMPLAVPAGLEMRNINNFKKSIEAGPDERGLYKVFKTDGTLDYYAPFYDVFWRAFGMPSVERVETQKMRKEIISDKFKYSRAKQQAEALMYKGDEDSMNKAFELIDEYGISDIDLDKYNVPFNERVYKTLPAILKAKYAPRIFPEAK